MTWLEEHQQRRDALTLILSRRERGFVTQPLRRHNLTVLSARLCVLRMAVSRSIVSRQRLPSAVDSGGHQEMPLGPGTARRGARDRDVGIDAPGVDAGVGELTALYLGVAAGMSGLLVPAGAATAVGGHTTMLPFFAKGAQEATVSISTSAVKRAFFVTNPAFMSGGQRVSRHAR